MTIILSFRRSDDYIGDLISQSSILPENFAILKFEDVFPSWLDADAECKRINIMIILTSHSILLANPRHWSKSSASSIAYSIAYCLFSTFESILPLEIKKEFYHLEHNQTIAVIDGRIKIFWPIIQDGFMLKSYCHSVLEMLKANGENDFLFQLEADGSENLELLRFEYRLERLMLNFPKDITVQTELIWFGQLWWKSKINNSVKTIDKWSKTFPIKILELLTKTESLIPAPILPWKISNIAMALGHLRSSNYMCSSCGRINAPQVCSICGFFRYCGSKCQKENWKLHKINCARYKGRHPNQIEGEILWKFVPWDEKFPDTI